MHDIPRIAFNRYFHHKLGDIPSGAQDASLHEDSRNHIRFIDEADLASWYPTLAAKSKARRGWAPMFLHNP
jgi:hypothetical protein